MRPDYRRSIVNLTAAIEAHYGLRTKHPSLERAKKAIEDRRPAHIVVLLLDGMGENVLGHLGGESMLRRNHQETITSVFPSTTTAATTAVLTGQTPLESGFLGWFMFFEKERLHYEVFMNRDYYDKNKEIPKGFFTKHFTRESFLSRIEATGKAKAASFQPRPVDEDGHPSFEAGVRRLRDFQAKHGRTVSYFYEPEPDLTEHEHGTRSDQTKRSMRKLDAHASELLEEVQKDTLIFVTADHGLIDVEPIPLFEYHDLTSTFRHLPANEPRMTSFFIKDGHHEHFIRFFNEHFSEDFDLYTKEELLSRGLLGSGEPHPLVDDTLGDFIAVAHGRRMFKLSDDKDHLAHHGGMSEAEMKVPLIILDSKGGRS